MNRTIIRRLWISQLALLCLCATGSITIAQGQLAPPPVEPEVFEEAAPTINERARNILEAAEIGEVAIGSIQFLQELESVLAELIASSEADTEDPLKVFDKGNALIRAAEAEGTWGIQFSNNVSPAAFLINRLITPGAVAGAMPKLGHANFVLSVLRTSDDPLLFIDRLRLGILLGSIAEDQSFAPAEEAVKAALNLLQESLVKENIALALPGYHAFFQRLASDTDELNDLIEALRKEATLATDASRAAIAREMLIVGQIRYDRMLKSAANTASYSDYFRERLTSPEWSPGARILLTETALYETGDVLSLVVHEAGWKAMKSSMEEGSILPEQALAIFDHTATHALDPDFAIKFKPVATAWAERIHQAYSNATPVSKPSVAITRLLNKLIEVTTAAGAAEELALLAAVPVDTADLHWLLTVLEHAKPDDAADYFLRFASEFDLRVDNSALSQCKYEDEFVEQHLPQVIKSMESAAHQWLLRVTIAALPDEALTSPSSTQTFRKRERRLEELAKEHGSYDFDENPDIEMAALRWFAEEYEVTLELTDAFAKVGATIEPQEFVSPIANNSLDGKRRIITTWLRHSLSSGPEAFSDFLDGMASPGRFYEVVRTVGSLASGLLQAFDEDAEDWPAELRNKNLPLFRQVISRPEMASFNSSFLGRFIAAGLIFHAIDGDTTTIDTIWSEMDSTLRDGFLRGEDDFFQWFGYMMRTAMNGRKLDDAGMQQAVRGIHGSAIYLAMCEETYSGARRFFKEAVAAQLITEELLCEIGPELVHNNPRNGYAAEELAEIQEKAGQIDAALTSWDTVIETAPASSSRRYTKAFLAKAGLLERAGRFTEALAALKQLDTKRLDKSEKASFQNTLKELRILTLSEKRSPSEMLRYANQGLQLQPDSIQGRLSAAAVFRALRLRATEEGNDEQAWAFGFLAAHTLFQLERDEKDITDGRLTSALSEFNDLHVGLGKPGGIVTLIPKGHDWKYSNKPQPADWMQAGFDDSNWLSGNAPLGYGSSDINSAVDFGSDRKNKPITTYFRTSFFLRESESVRRISFDLRRDDAAVVYINGEEVVRDNLPDGNLSADTKATDKTSGSDETRYFPSPFSPKRLSPGANTIAVAVHQYDRASSDLVFDAELIINDLGADTTLNAVTRSELLEALGALWTDVPQSIRQRTRSNG